MVRPYISTMSGAIPAIVLMLTVTSRCSASIPDTFPPDLLTCLLDRGNSSSHVTEPSDTNRLSDRAVFLECLEHFLWKTDKVNWENYNIRPDHVTFVRSLTQSILKGPRRSKRQFRPTTGFRVRQEIRRLTPTQWRALHNGLNVMKRNGQYDMFANIHSGIVINAAHMGPNFLGWHRVYLSVFEEALRRIDNTLALPYWDTTLDFDMTDPADSIIWTAGLLGNGDGLVTQGGFANWRTPAPLTRSIGGGSRLMSKPVIRNILSRCRTWEISVPTAQPQFNLELNHGGAHEWVGGQMSGLNTTAHDPVFYIYHAFVDYIWELFRIRQSTSCDVDPGVDYPAGADGLHAARRPMDRMPPYRNIGGFARFWTRFWYTYEDSPTCSRTRPTCGSPLLWCDTVRLVCVSRERRPQMNAQAGMQPFTLDVGPRFVGPPADPRNRGFNGRRKRTASAVKPGTGHLMSTLKSPSSEDQQSLPPLSDWAMIPIDIIYTRPQSTGCALNTSVDEVNIFADGITYSDTFAKSAVLDRQNGPSISVVDVGVKVSLGSVTSEVIVNSYDTCGKMCQAVCSPVDEVKYRPCSGVIRVTWGNPVTYSAVENKGESDKTGNTRLAFVCGSYSSSGGV